MPIYIEMPKLSDTMTEGTLVKWLKSEGDAVEIGDELAEIETDKATMAMEAFDDGVLHKILVAEGAKVSLGGKLAVLLEEGEEPPGEEEIAAAAAQKSEGSALGEAASGASPAAPAGVAAAGEGEADASGAATGGRVKASPLARKIADEKNIDLNRLQGSGPGGRIVRKDVEAAVAGGAQLKEVAARTPPLQPPAPDGAGGQGEGDKRIPLSGMRTVIAERLLASKTKIPHFYLNIEVDAAPMMDMRKRVNAASERTGGNKFTVNDFVLKAVVGAVADEPRVNASFAGDSIVQFGSVDLSVAIAVDDGLLTPVIRGAEKKSLLEISRAVKDLAERARSKKLSPDEFQGGTLTVSNLGAYGVDSFDAIINPPQAAILSIGAIVQKPVVSAAGEVVPGLRLWVGMSCDHRVIDGAIGATYLAALKRLLENPALMLL